MTGELQCRREDAAGLVWYFAERDFVVDDIRYSPRDANPAQRRSMVEAFDDHRCHPLLCPAGSDG